MTRSTKHLLLFLFLGLSVSGSQTKPFTFAWLSDTHVGGTTGAADLSASVHDLNSLQDVAFVILSGDITEMGSNGQLELAKAILDSLNKPYYLVPGNHDTKWSESGCTTFPQLFGNDRFVFEHGGYRFIGLHQGPIMKMGDGHFAPEDLRWVDSVLTNLPDPDQPLFIVTHYPLDSGIDNWYLLLEKIKRRNTQAVLVGHGHRNRIMNFEGVPATMGRSNLRANQQVGGYTIAEIRADTIFFSERLPGSGSKPVWHKIPLGQREYRRDTSTHQRPDFSVNQRFSHVMTRWDVNTEYTIASSPAVSKNQVIVGNSSGTIVSLSLNDGAGQWSFKSGSAVYSTPDIANGRVVVGSSDKNIYCLDVATGRVFWKVGTGAPVVAAPRIENEIAYIGASDGVFRAIDLQTGTIVWEYKDVKGFVETKPLIYQDLVVFGAWDTYLYALNKKNGSLAWKWSNGNAGILFSPAACRPVAADGKIFIVAPDRYMTAIDASTGRTIWRSNRYQVRESIGLSEDGSRVYAKCMADTLVAFSTSANEPTPIWVTHCGYGYDIDPSMPIEKDGVVFFGTKNGLVVALDGKSGAILWQHRVGVSIVSTPVPLSRSRVLVTDLDGRVMMVETR
ncbi:MAG TPA: metallophosphoesterase [Bacteroidetes bacterium]|nr:metallophosphoesterase [Bacteroidota bacterium]